MILKVSFLTYAHAMYHLFNYLHGIIKTYKNLSRRSLLYKIHIFCNVI